MKVIKRLLTVTLILRQPIFNQSFLKFIIDFDIFKFKKTGAIYDAESIAFNC